VSLARLEDHRRLWNAKPALREVYAVWFEAVLDAIAGAADVLEIGAGPGFLTERARARDGVRRWVSADLVPVPWNDLAADAGRLPFPADTFDAIAAVDVVHHLPEPARFFREARRVLRPGGRIATIEPWVTPLSFPVYRWLHQEGCTLGLDPWNPFGHEVTDGKDPFEGDAAVLWRLVRATPASRWRELGFAPPRVTRLNGFAYLLSLGFREASLLPASLAAPIIKADRGLSPLSGWLGMRALAVWERRTG